MPLTENKAALVAIVALAFAGALATAWDLALIWDGGAQFCYTLYHGRGYAYAARFFSAIVWTPVIWGAHFTSDLGVLRAIYALPLCLAPAISAALSWWMVRGTRSALFPWALAGIAVASAPVQVFVINESIFQLNLFWPVFLGLLVPLNWPRRIVLAALLVFQFSHPQGLLLLGGATLALALRREGTCFRRRAIFMAIVTALCLVRIVAFPDPEAAQQATVDKAWALFRQGVLGWPLVGAACFATAVWARSDRRANVALWLAAAIWLWWAIEPARWVKAMDARRFVILFAAPFFIGAWRSWSKAARPELPGRAMWIAMIFAATFAVQANGWRALMTRVIAQVEADPRRVIPREDFAWTRGSPADHWGLGPQVIAKLGGRKLVLDEAARAALRELPPRVELGFDAWVSPEPGALGWFDFRETVR